VLEGADDRRRVDQHRCGVTRRTKGLRVWKRMGGNSISPARCSMSNKPRQTIARKAPLACFHCHISQSFSESLRRLAPGFSAINWRIEVTSAPVTTRPRYLHSEAICRQCARAENGTQEFCCYFFQALTCRHTGAASTSGFPAASSNCA
jgi:hypothetical protein